MKIFEVTVAAKHPSPKVAAAPGPERSPVEQTAEDFIAKKRIGERIRKLRLSRNMGLVELGRHTGLSASFLSQLETGRVVPTIRNLARIAMVFTKDLSFFFDSEPEPLFAVHRKQHRIRLPQQDPEEASSTFESLGYQVPDRVMDLYFARFEPLRDEDTPKPHAHAGYEAMYIVSGALEIAHGQRVELLEAGDSVYFDATTPHSYRSVGQQAAEAVVVTSPPLAFGQPQKLRPASVGVPAEPPRRARG